jgi:hypothetical protein
MGSAKDEAKKYFHEISERIGIPLIYRGSGDRRLSFAKASDSRAVERHEVK